MNQAPSIDSAVPNDLCATIKSELHHTAHPPAASAHALVLDGCHGACESQQLVISSDAHIPASRQSHETGPV